MRMSRVNNGAGRRPGGANRYYLSMEKKKIVENRKIEGTRHIVTSLLAMLEQDHGAGRQPGQECAALGAAVMGEQRAGGGAPLPLALTRRLMLLGRMHAQVDGQAAGGGACGWQPADAMVLAPGVRELILHAVQLWDELATGWGGVPVYDGLAERLAPGSNANGLGCSPSRTPGADAPGTWRLGACSPTRGCKGWLRQPSAATSCGVCVALDAVGAATSAARAGPDTHAGPLARSTGRCARRQ